MTIRTTCIGAYPKPEYIEIDNFAETAVILGVVTIANSKFESTETIQQRLELALQHIDADRLLAATDCGLMMLGRDLAMAKLKNMCAAARTI
jgi:5-methyltetrahydropteroyltriglutamate--homocysteine methyltransferase